MGSVGFLKIKREGIGLYGGGYLIVLNVVEKCRKRKF